MRINPNSAFKKDYKDDCSLKKNLGFLQIANYNGCLLRLTTRHPFTLSFGYLHLLVSYGLHRLRAELPRTVFLPATHQEVSTKSKLC